MRFLDYMNTWMSSIGRLPLSLQNLRFYVYPVYFPYYDSRKGKISVRHLRRLVQKALKRVPNARVTFPRTTKGLLSAQGQDIPGDVIELLLKPADVREKPTSDSVCGPTSKVLGPVDIRNRPTSDSLRDATSIIPEKGGKTMKILQSWRLGMVALIVVIAICMYKPLWLISGAHQIFKDIV